MVRRDERVSVICGAGAQPDTCGGDGVDANYNALRNTTFVMLVLNRHPNVWR